MKATSESILAILSERGLLGPDHVREISDRLKAVAEGGKKAGGRKGKKGQEEEQKMEAGGADFLGYIASLGLRSSGRGRRLIDEVRLYEAVAGHLGLPFKRIDPLRLNLDLVTRTIPRPFAVRHLMVPLSRDEDALVLATADPFNAEGLENITRSTGCRISVVVATRSDVLKIINEFYGFKSSVVKAEEGMVPVPGALSSLEQYVRLKSVKEMEATDKHVVNAVDFLFSYAFDQRASDIHLEPKREKTSIRFRIDGILHSNYHVPQVIHSAMASRIKMLSRLDIAERRRPQDGRIKVDHKGRDFEIRVSTLPTAFGEKVVLRIFDPEVLLQDLSQLGFTAGQLSSYRMNIEQPHGVILVTGPTGSGKTTTLYSSLALLATDERNITTIEDPIEMVCEAFNQVGVQPQVGLTFDQSLRHILRQDPDIIMVGEIRDSETAENAIQAALTGHLVFSTLHTNDAATAVTRLADMGVPPYLIGTTLRAVAAQRLVRCICKHCAEVYDATAEEIASLSLAKGKKIKFRQGKGCPHCRYTGYLGRTAIFELMNVSPSVRNLIHEEATQAELIKVARKEGMRTLRESGIEKVLRGLTTVQEVLRVTMLD